MNITRICEYICSKGSNIREFFLTGPIWGSTVLCIYIRNMVHVHRVKLHLPHIYMIFLNVKENKHVHLFYNTTKLFNTFRVIRDPLKSFASNSLGPFPLLQRHFLPFFWFWPRSISSLPFLLANLIFNFLTILVPRPIMVAERSQKYLELPKEVFWYLLRFQIIIIFSLYGKNEFFLTHLR